LVSPPQAHFPAILLRRLQVELVFGHSYSIGSPLGLLSPGIAPEIIMTLSSWSSPSGLSLGAGLRRTRVVAVAAVVLVAMRRKEVSLQSLLISLTSFLLVAARSCE
jgi:hypothetical protein